MLLEWAEQIIKQCREEAKAGDLPPLVLLKKGAEVVDVAKFVKVDFNSYVERKIFFATVRNVCERLQVDQTAYVSEAWVKTFSDEKSYKTFQNSNLQPRDYEDKKEVFVFVFQERGEMPFYAYYEIIRGVNGKIINTKLLSELQQASLQGHVIFLPMGGEHD